VAPVGLLKRFRQADHRPAPPAARSTSLASDARIIRGALQALNARREELDPGRPEIDLRGLVSDLLRGEVEPPTGDVARLIRAGIEPDVFYEKELSRSWDGRDENHRVARVEQFAGLALMLEDAGEDARPPNYEQMLATVRTKTLVLAFAVDETYGLLRQIERDPTDLG
jgi:hypothetical protein